MTAPTPLSCSRCKTAFEPMPAPPFPGALGETVRRQVCAPCWKEWLGAQVNIINEHRLSMLKPEHRALLTAQMRAYLSLPD